VYSLAVATPGLDFWATCSPLSNRFDSTARIHLLILFRPYAYLAAKPLPQSLRPRYQAGMFRVGQTIEINELLDQIKAGCDNDHP
jgi:hypothetical protein